MKKLLFKQGYGPRDNFRGHMHHSFEVVSTAEGQNTTFDGLRKYNTRIYVAVKSRKGECWKIPSISENET